MSDPIKSREFVYERTGMEEKSFSYEDIIEMFPDGDGSLVNPLVRRCQKLEAQLAIMDDMATSKDEYAVENAGLKAELDDERTAFEHSNEVIGKLEADLAEFKRDNRITYEENNRLRAELAKVTAERDSLRALLEESAKCHQDDAELHLADESTIFHLERIITKLREVLSVIAAHEFIQSKDESGRCYFVQNPDSKIARKALDEYGKDNKGK